MRYIARGLALAGLSLGLAVAPAAGSAGAAPQEARSLYAPSALVLTVTTGDDAVNGTVLRAVTLGCAPTATGTHPAARAACAELRVTQGRFEAATAAAPGMSCTRQWDPVTVTADGVWNGKRVSYTHVFGNTCLQGASTGVVFDF
ncbi:subtilase-type protease inhibitor [Streptomyces genisteinicus]|uniref:Probable subtilase-type protease inhibitor n=1 Tax=Streptomyces genisteinicus TaxID=2768068 RepID=A0A7H0HZY3_9ACTN|nr:subtilase-type protease inhibitor [Streptomyces genisteinicus]QNP66099.1 subtilase-type protease inhibitor [Streptomyces genisteinicus]